MFLTFWPLKIYALIWFYSFFNFSSGLLMPISFKTRKRFLFIHFAYYETTKDVTLYTESVNHQYRKVIELTSVLLQDHGSFHRYLFVVAYPTLPTLVMDFAAKQIKKEKEEEDEIIVHTNSSTITRETDAYFKPINNLSRLFKLKYRQNKQS